MLGASVGSSLGREGLEVHRVDGLDDPRADEMRGQQLARGDRVVLELVPPTDQADPAIISIPIGCLCCWLGTMLSCEPADEDAYHELRVRAETGLGAAQ